MQHSLIVVLIGLPASGKTHLAGLLSAHFSGTSSKTESLPKFQLLETLGKSQYFALLISIAVQSWQPRPYTLSSITFSRKS